MRCWPAPRVFPCGPAAHRVLGIWHKAAGILAQSCWALVCCMLPSAGQVSQVSWSKTLGATEVGWAGSAACQPANAHLFAKLLDQQGLAQARSVSCMLLDPALNKVQVPSLHHKREGRCWGIGLLSDMGSASASATEASPGLWCIQALCIGSTQGSWLWGMAMDR